LSGRAVREADRQREMTELALKQLGNLVYEQIRAREFPWIMIQSRSTDNIIYDPELKQYVLGDRLIRRHSRNIAHIRPFAQLIWTAWFSRELLKHRKTSTLREVYYSARGQRDIEFKDQDESDNIITDLETALSRPREDFNIYPEERSAIFGDLTIEYTVPGYEGKRMNLTEHPDGVMIGPALTSAEFIETSADKVLVIEKGAMFTRLVEERAHERFNAILIHTAGQAPRSTRSIIQRLNQLEKMPVYIFTDGDPWGVHIAMVIISGSANAAHLRGLATPDARWIGVWASDIVEYRLPTEKLTDADIKRLRELKKDPRYGEELWQREIDLFLKLGVKAELEAFSRYGLTYIVDKYLPDKLEGS
jgi:DNA topoisomerase-6 subunit A